MSVSAISKTIPKKSIQRVQDGGEDDWENHVLLRFPPDMARLVDQIVSDDAHANDRININFDVDMRNGSIRVDSRVLPFKVYDLPCVTEVMKTVDKKSLYKVTDLSQMIVCSSTLNRDIARVRRASGGSSSGEGNPKKEVQWPHGITPPMKNARKCRFRKTKKKKYMDAPDVERELKRLLRSDFDANSVRWEVVPIEQKDRVNMANTTTDTNQQQEEMTEEKIVRMLDSLSDSGNEAGET